MGDKIMNGENIVCLMVLKWNLRVQLPRITLIFFPIGQSAESLTYTYPSHNHYEGEVLLGLLDQGY